MEHVEQLRALLRFVDPGMLEQSDYHALLDLAARTLQHNSGGALSTAGVIQLGNRRRNASNSSSAL